MHIASRNLVRILTIAFAVITVGAMGACSTLDTASPPRSVPQDTVRVIRGIPYATGHALMPGGQEGTKVLTLDVYMPAESDAAPRPSLLLIHGGGFTEGDPSQMAQLAHFFVERGFVCFASAYRLRRDRPDATPQAAVADTMAAVRWVRRHAPEYGGRSDAIGALGYSAGAYAAVAVAAANPDDYLVDGERILPFNTPDESPAVQAAVIVAGGIREGLALDPNDPPLLVIHGTRDQVVPIERGQAIWEAAQAAGVTCEFIAIERADHWPLNGEYEGRNVKEHAADFLHRYLDAPERPVLSTRSADTPQVPVEEGVNIPQSTPAPGAPEVTLDTTATRHGAVALEPPGGRYPAGTVVKLTPQPQKGYAFAYWAGDIRETRAPAYVVVDRDKRIEAGFMARPDAERVVLQTRVEGDGTLSVAPPLERHVKGDVVALTAQPARGATFVRWEGDITGNDPSAEFIMDADKHIAAIFETVVGADREVIRIPADGGVARLHVRGTGEWQATALWPVTGMDIERRNDAVRVACAPNSTASTRTTFLRLTAPSLGERYVQVPIVQEGALTPGRLAWWQDPSQPNLERVLMDNGDETYTLGTARGTAIGFLGDGKGGPLMIPMNKEFDVYAEWDLPSRPDLFRDPDAPAELGTTYCYVGIDSGAVNRLQLRFGIEWKNIGRGDEWVLRGQYESQQMAAVAQNNGKAPEHIRVRLTKRYDGEQGAATVRGAYSLDGGPWQPYSFTTPGHAEAYPLGERGEDQGVDFVTFKVRGLASPRFVGPVIQEPETPASVDSAAAF